MNLYGNYFEYAGVSSQTYNLIISNVETDPLYDIAGSIESNNIFNRRNTKFYYIGSDMSGSNLTFDIDITTLDCVPLTYTNQRAVERWLFNRIGYSKLYSSGDDPEYVDDVAKRKYLNCRLVNASRLEYNNGVIGYRCTVECDSPMAWQDAITKTISVNTATGTGSKTISLDVDTDFHDYIYPTVTITLGSVGGNIDIFNSSDDATRLTSFKSLTAGSIIIMDGEHNYISDSNYIHFSSRNFIRLIHGTNTFSISGNVRTIKFEWNNRRYM